MMIDQLTFIEKLAYNFLEGNRTAVMREIAWAGLEEGYETPALLALAGLEKNEENYVIYEYYMQALEELDLVFNNEDAALLLTRSVVDKVLNKGLDPYEACNIIFRDILELAGLNYLGKDLSYEGIGLKHIYGSCISMDHVIDDSAYIFHSKEELESLKQKTRMDMKEWLETYR